MKSPQDVVEEFWRTSSSKQHFLRQKDEKGPVIPSSTASPPVCLLPNQTVFQTPSRGVFLPAHQVLRDLLPPTRLIPPNQLMFPISPPKWAISPTYKWDILGL